MIKSFKWREQDGQIYDLEYAEGATEDELGMYTHVTTPPGMTVLDMVGLDVPDEPDGIPKLCTSQAFYLKGTTEFHRIWACKECDYLYLTPLSDKQISRVVGYHIDPRTKTPL